MYRSGCLKFIVIVLIFVIGTLLYIRVMDSISLRYSAREDAPVRERVVTPPPSELGADERSNIQIFENVSPSVVYITNSALRRDFFSFNVFEVPQGTGSGIIWDKSGNIVTNFHVIYNASKISVILQDKSSYEANIVGTDPDHDLAVINIKSPAGNLAPIPVGTSKDLRVGQKVLAIGNPFGLDYTLTTGIISALGRTIESMTNRTIHDVIQTDAAINPGNSGGPLLDSYGRLIGINTAITSPSGAYAGIGFAVPVDLVNRYVPQLIKHGKIIRPGLGISLLPDYFLEQWGVQGACILNISKGSAAADAQLKETQRDVFGNLTLGDIIVKVDKYPIKSNNDLIDVLDSYRVGDEISLEYLRDKKIHKTKIRLQAL